MKKTYIVPVAKTILLDTEESMAQILNGSGSDGLNERLPEYDNDDNNFSNRRDGIWGNTEW